MGTMIQRHRFDEEAFRGERFAEHGSHVKGNNDLLVLTQPKAIADIQSAYLAAGADIISTNTFNTQRISLADYGMESLAAEMNLAAARLAREAADACDAQEPANPASSRARMGPTNRTASHLARRQQSGLPQHQFRRAGGGLRRAGARPRRRRRGSAADRDGVRYAERQGGGLCGAAGLRRAGRGVAADRLGYDHRPLGSHLSGQTAEAFFFSVRHLKPFAVGLNCALGAELMRPYLAEIAAVADTLTIAYPNAGLPNAMGEYDEGPDEMACQIGPWAKDGLLNIVGGCCGSTPEHIAEIKAHVSKYPPRSIPRLERKMRLSGLEPFVHG